MPNVCQNPYHADNQPHSILHLSKSVKTLYNACKISLQQNILASYVTQKYLSLSFFKFFREETTKKVKKVWVLIFY